VGVNVKNMTDGIVLYSVHERLCVVFRFDIMYRCWNDEPTARPTFDQLVTWIEEVIGKARPAGTRTTEDSRLYLNVVERCCAAVTDCQCQPAAAVRPDTTWSSDTQLEHDEEMGCT